MPLSSKKISRFTVYPTPSLPPYQTLRLSTQKPPLPIVNYAQEGIVAYQEGEEAAWKDVSITGWCPFCQKVLVRSYDRILRTILYEMAPFDKVWIQPTRHYEGSNLDRCTSLDHYCRPSAVVYKPFYGEEEKPTKWEDYARRFKL